MEAANRNESANDREVDDRIGIFSAHSEQGKRGEQEDRYVAETVQLEDKPMQVLAVMDGHSGADVAQYTAEHLVGALRETYTPEKNIAETLDATVAHIHEKTRQSDAGSTLSIVAIPEDKSEAYVAILGDSPVIIHGADGLNISPIHNARSNMEERDKAVKRDAVFDPRGFLVNPKVGSGIQMSRALGDKDFDYFLERKPETYSVKLDEDSSVIVATDGLLDPAHHNTDKEAERITQMVSGGADARSLVEDALTRGGSDNTTAIVWRAFE